LGIATVLNVHKVKQATYFTSRWGCKKKIQYSYDSFKEDEDMMRLKKQRPSISLHNHFFISLRILLHLPKINPPLAISNKGTALHTAK
jgi:hypothetical protein